MADADDILNARRAELETVDQAVMGEVVGVAQAIGDLRNALDALDGHLDDRKFERAAALGYQDIASAFIFLQRTLGGLQSAEHIRHEFISSIAEQLQCPHEDAEPLVAARLQCLKPRQALNGKELAASKARLQQRLGEMRG
ncbi:hypothetical protein VK792_18485 [Mesobacterium sp. TK19101]|uniref:Uncharacterized protein n=1 Tax=Mesobacterium hydrothermale TaxID=3111907 RepID=A0ABU6HLT8_9RHOB|nr:hypothetical protein [Mesobacterium sp. TK19101]MEC3863281.1 hypothetical protein [Mesobacterium sp. TK19101]